MPIKVLYNDLRVVPPKLERFIVEWHQGLTAEGTIQAALGLEQAQKITDDLERNDPEIMVSYSNDVTDERSDYGGVGTVDWEIDDRTVLVVTYENSNTTAAAIDEAIEWMLEDEKLAW